MALFAGAKQQRRAITGKNVNELLLRPSSVVKKVVGRGPDLIVISRDVT